VINLKIRDYIDIFKKYDILDCEIDEDCSNVQFTVSVYKDSDIEIVMDFTDDSDTYDGDDIDIKFWISFGMITLWEIRYEDIKEIRDNHRYPELISDVIKVCHEFEDGYITRRTRDEEISELRQKYYQIDKESEE
jgi:hypothetical protein